MLITKSYNLNDQDLIKIATSFCSRPNSDNLEEQLLHWEFGPIMEMKVKENPANYLFSKEKVPFHWDGAFYRGPKKLLFYCTSSEGEGGETLFVNTTKVWNSLDEKMQELLKKVKLTYKTEKLAHYGGEFSCDLVQKHPLTNEVILRLAEAVTTELNPVSLEMKGVNQEEALFIYNFLVAKFYAPAFLYSHKWEVGDLLICDNFTYLHGRNSVGNNLTRTFKRIQIL